jgi:hypothetical protein
MILDAVKNKSKEVLTDTSSSLGPTLPGFVDLP